ncbi:MULTISPECIES: type II 3-dehydroquinate dehydratase [Petrotoga]|uniref:3-dehydroquinate dehydratase n=2 Tax=Petrotoga sibirica TaxID=156202 RepID=A0A4R8EVH1_9BACT|nr:MULTISPECIES: type II 3-dehydroquinate dehydratase [Petrotoga]POZ88415.1 3-dehydroquinate dehydratase [Petrotoga sibirica DSM 13575]POZ90376.1 3-dehydroquinate dehydratase [Petrotoga sp. SL27]TDX16449.1 3-dehydroquinate dehydratase [Petrotoga sibirica]
MILIINGPNLNMLGKRPKDIYGTETYEDLKNQINHFAQNNSIDVGFFQSNSEGQIIDRIQKSDFEALIINPGAYTHYSYAIRDALEIVNVPKVEVHLTNIMARESFRQNSVTSSSCDGVISGLGFYGYILALEYLKEKLKEQA